MNNLVCPISHERVDENRVRLNAVFVVSIIIVGVVWTIPGLTLLVAVDFFLRGFTKCKMSPIGYMSNFIISSIGLKNRMIDKAPKIFAARLGFIMTALIFVFTVTGLNIAAYSVAGILVFCATLEFAFKICVGCLVYTYLVLPLFKSKD